MISHQKKKKILSFKKILTEILVTSNHISFKRTLVEKNPAASSHVSKWKILIRNKTIS